MACADRLGWLLLSKVQVVGDMVVSARTKMTVSCQVTTRNYCPSEAMEGCLDGLMLAMSLNQPRLKGSVVIRCLNLMDQPLFLQAGITVGKYTGVEDH